MNKNWRRVCSILMVTALLVTSFPTSVFATEDPSLSVEPVVEIVETAEEPTPAAEPAEEESADSSEPEVTEPEVTEPEVTEPETTEPETTEPETTEPETTEPETTEPETTEPETTEPETTEPETTEPETTEPETTEPETTEPETTEPAADGEEIVEVEAPEQFAEGESEFVIEDGALMGYNGTDTVVTVPDGVLTITDEAFSGDMYNQITKIVLSDSVTSINSYAMSGMASLETIVLSANLKRIGTEAFFGCDRLQNVQFADEPAEGVELSIGESAFIGTGIETIELPENIIDEGNSFLNGCAYLKTVIVPKNAALSGSGFLGDREYDGVVIHTYYGTDLYNCGIDEGAFDWYLLDDDDFIVVDGVLEAYAGNGGAVTVPDNVSEIGWGAFQSVNADKITSVTLPDSVETIVYMGGMEMLETVNFAESAEGVQLEIEAMAFENCPKLADVELPENVILNEGIFSNCESMESIVIPGSATIKSQWGIGVKMLVPYGSNAHACIIELETMYAEDERDLNYELTDLVLESITLYCGEEELGDEYIADLGLGSKITLTAEGNPVGADSSVKWKSSNTKIATVSAAGVVTLKKAGTVKITATSTENTDIATTVTLKVTRLVHEITLSSNAKVTNPDAIAVGTSVTMKATVSPSKAANKTVTWVSSDPELLSISAKGVLTVNADETYDESNSVTITAIANDGSGVEATYEMLVVPAASEVAIYVMEADEEPAVINGETHGQDVADGKTVQLYGVAGPSSYAYPGVTWKSSNTKIATVNADGLVTFKKVGKVTITATAQDGAGAKATTTVNYGTLVKALEISGGTMVTVGEETFPTVTSGKTATLKATVTEPAKPTSKTVNWYVDDEFANFASINNKGVVTAAAGITEPTVITVIAVAADGGYAMAEYELTILPAVETIEIYEAVGNELIDGVYGLDKDIGKTVQLTTASYPENANQGVKWTTSNKKVATVSADGLVTFKKTGKVTITATATDGTGVKSTAVVNYGNLIEQLEISGPTQVTGNKSITLKATASCEVGKPTSSAVTWTSSNTDVAAVNAKGVVTGSKSLTDTDTVVITATAADGSGVYAEYTVTVLPFVQEIVLESENANGNTLMLDSADEVKTATITATTYPEAAGDSVTWKSSSTKIATVSTAGVVTFKKAGSVTITVTAADGSGAKATMYVTYGVPAEGIAITGAEEVTAGKSITLKAAVTPSNATNKTYTWKLAEGDEAYASISTKGVLTGNKSIEQAQTVTVYAVSNADSTVYAEHVVDIRPLAQEVFILNGDEDMTGETILLHKDDSNTVDLDAVVNPADASQKVTWKSSNTKIATVNTEGVVTFKKVGKVTITATAADGSGKKATVTVNYAKFVEDVAITGNTNVGANKKITLKAEVTPSDATTKTVTWKSSDTSVATVTGKGIVTGNKNIKEATEVTITATATDGTGIVAEHKIWVGPAVTSVSILKDDEVVNGDTFYFDTGCENPDDLILTLDATTAPDGAGDEIVWTSSNKAVATVTDGVVTVLKAGKATITAAATDGSGKKATVTVSASKLVQDIKVTGTTELLAVGKTTTLKATVYPTDATNKSYTWKSENTSVATISSKGVVTAKKVTEPTEVWFQAVAKDGSEVMGEYCITIAPATTKVYIYKAEDETRTPLTGTLGVDFDGEEVTIDLNSYTDPENAVDWTLWSSNNEDVATVEPEEGIVTVIAAGKATITAAAADGTGKKASIVINAANMVEEINIFGTTDELGFGKTTTLSYTVYPEDATTQTVTWKSSDTSVATVSSTGVVKASSKLTEAKEVTIYAVANDGSGVVGEYPMTIRPLATEIRFVEPNGLLGKNDIIKLDLNKEADSVPLEALVLPGDLEAWEFYASQKVEWSSADESIATVDESGEVWAVAEGTTTVTAKALDGSGVKGTVTVNVRYAVKNVTLTGAEELTEGQTAQLTAAFTPENATNKGLIWSSSDETVATVDQNGVVSVKDISETKTVTITATSVESDEDNIIAGTIEMTLIPKADKVILTLDGEEITGELSIDLSREREICMDDPIIEPADASSIVTWTCPENADEEGAGILIFDEGAPAGKYVFTATATDGSGAYATVTINAFYGLTDLTIDGPDEMSAGTSAQMEIAAYEPENATYVAVTDFVWTSGDETIATVDENGVVTAAATVEAREDVIIMATAKDGSETYAEKIITVCPIPQRVDVCMPAWQADDNESVTMSEEGYVLTASVYPEEASQTLTWTSSDSAVATIEVAEDDCGTATLTTAATGTTTITVTADNGVKFEILLTVKAADENITGVSQGFAYEMVGEEIVITECPAVSESGALVIPEELKGVAVTAIADSAFANNSEITSAVIPDSVNTLGENAFGGCVNLETIELSENITEIADGAFEGCTGLTTVKMSNDVTVIGKAAFKGCTSLQSFEYETAE